MSTSLPVQLVPVETVDLPEGPRIPCVTAALPREDLADSRRFEGLIEVLCLNLAQLAPRSDRFLWFAQQGPEAFVSMTPGRARGVAELTRLVAGFDARILAVGSDVLEWTARPILMWSKRDGVVRLWEGEPTTSSSDRLRSISVRHRRFLLDPGLPWNEPGRPAPRPGVRQTVVVEVPYSATADGPRPLATGLVFSLSAPPKVLPRAAVKMLAAATLAGGEDLVAWIWNADPYARKDAPGELAESVVLAVTCRGGGIPKVGSAYTSTEYFDTVLRIELPPDATPIASVRGLGLITFMSDVEAEATSGPWTSVSSADAVVDWDVGLPLEFRVREVTLRNFRSFKDVHTFQFPEQTTLIIGDNGKGKTAILDGLAVGLSSAVNALARGHTFDVREVWMHREWVGDPPTEVVHDPSSAQIELRLNARRTVKEGGSFSRGREMGRGIFSATWALNVLRAVNEGRPVDLPVIAYYRALRHDDGPKAASPKRKGERARLSPYESWDRAQVNPVNAQRWFRSLWLDDISATLRDYPRPHLPILKAVESALISCIDECTGVSWTESDEDMLLHFGSKLRAYSELSDGYRLTTALVLDLAWRCFVHNPHLSGRAAELSPGVVLIDEIDLHMHPTWQRLVVSALRSTFGKIQFVLTSHSPFVVQSMRVGEVINLDPHDAMEYWREGIEDIAVEVMGVGAQPLPRSTIYREFEALSDRYMALLQRLDPSAPQVNDVRRELDRLQEDLSGNPAVAAVLRAQRLAREAKQ